ncbi:reverse transcriptase domain-containing protein [Tanacetum coccineum]
MRTRSSSNLVGESSPNPTTLNPRRRNRRRSKQPFSLEESPVDTMADQHTMAELLRAPTEGYAEAIMVPPILAVHFELKHSLINMMTSDQFFGLEKDNPHDHIRWFNKITSTIKYKDVPNSTIKLMLFPFSLVGAAHPTPPPASVKAVEEICVTCGGAHPYYQCLAADGNTFPEYQDNIQGYVLAAAKLTTIRLEKIKKINEVNIKAMQAQINNVKNELRNEMQTSIQASMSNQTNELKNMMASFFLMNTASTSGLGSLHSNTIANPKGELKSITTQSGLVLDGPSVPMPLPFINLEKDERVEETLMNPEQYTIKVPPPLVQKAIPTFLKNYMVHKRDPLHPNIPYPSRMHQEKQQEKDEKLLELTNTPLNENCSAIILKKLPEKLGDPEKFLIPYGFSELKCKALADLGARINLMPLSVWKKLGLPKLISTRMTLELANRTICTPAGIARDVFVLVGKFTFPADFVIVDYESDPQVPSSWEDLSYGPLVL